MGPCCRCAYVGRRHGATTIRYRKCDDYTARQRAEGFQRRRPHRRFKRPAPIQSSSFFLLAGYSFPGEPALSERTCCWSSVAFDELYAQHRAPACSPGAPAGRKSCQHDASEHNSWAPAPIAGRPSLSPPKNPRRLTAARWCPARGCRRSRSTGPGAAEASGTGAAHR